MNFHCQVSNISDFLAGARFAIGAGGSTGLERLFFLLPTITIITAENQIEATGHYDSRVLIKNLGWHNSVTADDIYHASLELIRNPALIADYQKKMNDVKVGSRGATYVVRQIQTFFSSKNQVTSS